jgi:hypothetical protein
MDMLTLIAEEITSFVTSSVPLAKHCGAATSDPQLLSVQPE